MGTKLFVKDGRQISLTSTGKEFLPFVEKALDQINQGTETIRQSVSKDGNLVKLGYCYSISSNFVPNVISHMYNFPTSKKINFQFTLDVSKNIINLVKKDTIELGFTMHKDRNIETLPVLQQRMFLVVPNSHPLAKKENVTLADFIKEPIIVLDKNSNQRNLVKKIYAKAEAEPLIAFEVNECNEALKGVARGLGISILPHLPSIEALLVKFIPLDDAAFSRIVYLAWHKGRKLSPAAKYVRDFLEQHYVLKDVN